MKRIAKPIRDGDVFMTKLRRTDLPSTRRRFRRVIAIVTRGDGRRVICYSIGGTGNRLCLEKTFRRAVRNWRLEK